MSERGLPIADGAHACPFVAFEDDRDERSTVPDHRHRCYAEVRPAPRALAHQEAYCLSSSFPVCPTFQDWARRESARARAAATAPEPPPEPAAAHRPVDGPVADAGLAAAAAVEADEADEDVESAESAATRDTAAAWEANAAREADDRESRRNPPREWSAPPPWLASAEAANRSTSSEPPEFLSRRSDPAAGLAGSAADLLAGGSPPKPSSSAYRPSGIPVDRDDDEPDFEARDLPRPAVPPRRSRAYQQHLGGPSDGPDWERPRRYEAYPTIKARIGMPRVQVPRLALMAAAIAIAALGLFFLPALLGFGAKDQVASSPSPSPSPSGSIAPTQPPAPTPIVYTIQAGDTLTKVATAHGLTLEQLLTANPDIKDPNKIIKGQQITIPAPEPEVPDEFGGSASPSASAAAP